MSEVGAAGELIAQVRLLRRGWITANVNSGGYMNSPAIDLFAAKDGHKISIAVKATNHNNASVQWGVKPDWTTLFKGDTHPDFVIFVRFTGIDEHKVYVVPAEIVDATMKEAHDHWHKHARRDGAPRKLSSHTAFCWDGAPTDGNIARGFANKWAQYEEAWHLLER